MQQIDLDPRKHSSTYELKPMSRWWMVYMLALTGFATYVNGWDNAGTWFLLVTSWALGLATLLTNPQKWLSKLD